MEDAARTRLVITVYSAIILSALFLLFYNLDDRLLWADEAETAILAENIIKFGVPRVKDGKNYIRIVSGKHEHNKDYIWTWSPWLDEYIAAGSFLLLGKSTYAARLPFAVVGFLSVPFLIYVSYRIFRRHEPTIIAVLLYLTTAAFLLHARQCRYYSLIIFAQIGLIYGYKLLVGESPWRGCVYIVLALTVQFYCNYILAAGNILALCIAAILMRRRYPPLVVAVIICLAAFSAIAAPWLLYAQPWHQAHRTGFRNFTAYVGYYASIIHLYLMPIPVLLLAVVMRLLRRDKGIGQTASPGMSDVGLFLWVLMPSHLFILGMAPESFFRYVLVLIPAVTLLASHILTVVVHPVHLRYLLVGVLGLSNIISELTAAPFKGTLDIQMPIVQFVREITSHYEDRLSAVAHYLQQNGRPGQSLCVRSPEFPLIFYTGMCIIDARFDRTIDAQNPPDWILRESASGIFDTAPIVLPEALASHYERIVLTVPDTPRHACRPSPEVHGYFTADKQAEFVLYRKIR